MNSQSMLVVLLNLVMLHARLSSSRPDVPQLERKTEEKGEHEKTRVKRSLIWNLNNLKKMVKCATGRRIRDYKGYGCWCGSGGRGTPVDGIDECCREHDKCFDRIKSSKICEGNSIRAIRYEKIGCLRCAPEWQQPLQWWNNQRLISKCKYRKCLCDTELMDCLKRNRYNRRYKNYKNSKC